MTTPLPDLTALDARLCAAVARRLGVDPATVTIADHRPASGAWAGSGATEPVFSVPAASRAAAIAAGLVVR